MSILFPISFLIGYLNVPECYFQPIRSTVQFPQERKRVLQSILLKRPHHAPFFPFNSPFHYLGRHPFVWTFLFRMLQFNSRGLLEAPHRASSAQGTQFELLFSTTFPAPEHWLKRYGITLFLGYGNSKSTTPITF
jgi:hypothetical protein